MITGDLDTEVDFDGEGDVDLSGIFSFKGLLHFGIGFSWSMWFGRDQKNQFLVALIAVGIGILTSLVLALVYWGALKLKKEIIPEKGEDLIGRVSEIYYSGPGDDEWIVFTEINGGRREISAVSMSGREYQAGEKIEIIGYQDGVYRIP